MTHLLAAAALVLQISNVSGAPPAIVQAAQDEVTRLYADIGVPLEWSDAHAAVDPHPHHPAAVRDRRPAPERETGDGCVGAHRRRQRVAYVFYHRVRAEAHRYDVSTELVLACAIAHELGHLLLPMRGHSADGLMRACWSRNEFHRAEQGAAEVSCGRRGSRPEIRACGLDPSSDCG